MKGTARFSVILALTVVASLAAPVARGEDSVIHACVNRASGFLHIVQPGEACSPNETALEWNIQGPPGPAGAQGPAGPPAAVSTACSGDVALVTTCPTPDTCVTHKYPCTPYTCDAVADTCRAGCLSNADCAQGASCNTASGKCASMGSACKDDFTIEDSDGQIESCIPYECKAGACQQQCVSANDCYEGYTCVQSHCTPE